jgi:hypothetical protein
VGKKASYLQYFCRKTLVKRPLGRHKHRREDNIKMYSQKIGWGVDWIEQGQVEDSCKHGN